MKNPSEVMQRVSWVLWPAFLVACAAELIVFSAIDPHDLHAFGRPIDLPRETVYALGFFLFWGLGIVSSSLSVFLTRSPWEVNRCPVDADRRPASCAKLEAADAAFPANRDAL